MKRSITKIFTIAACAAMMLTAMPMQSVQAATTAQGTISLSTQKLIISKGVKTAMVNKTLTMVKNRRYQVKAKFGKTTVSKTGTYKSSKPAVATVSSTGLVTAKAPGTATIKVTYNNKSQSFKVKVIASHKHAWKTTRKATCAVKGKKLCQTCGCTGTTAMKTTHTFKTTKKATCEKSGTQTCTVCGTTAKIAKTSHNWRTATTEILEGRGKPHEVTVVICGGCETNMTHWTKEQINKHQGNFNNFQCFGAAISYIHGVNEYPQYFMVQYTEITCKNCGAWKDNYKEDLYECDWGGNPINKSDAAKASNNVTITESENDVIVDNTDIIDSDEIIVDEPIISDNSVVSENMIETE